MSLIILRRALTMKRVKKNMIEWYGKWLPAKYIQPFYQVVSEHCVRIHTQMSDYMNVSGQYGWQQKK